MAYVAVRGGKTAIAASVDRLFWERCKEGFSVSHEELSAGMRLLVDQVMSESSLYAPRTAVTAIKQAEGSPEEAVFLLRAYRSTLPRSHYSRVVESADMRVERRISACFKDIAGGQILGASLDYTHRLIDFDLDTEGSDSISTRLQELKQRIDAMPGRDSIGKLPKVVDYLRREGLLRTFPHPSEEPKDVTKKSIEFPTVRSERLQILARAQTGTLTSLGYASLRGYGHLHPTVAELRVGTLPILVDDPLLADRDGAEAYYIGEIRVTEVEMLVPVTVDHGNGKTDIEFEIGYGVCYGQNETKAIAMSLIDQCLEHPDPTIPTHNEEFVLLHVDSVEATGFISHLKLPHYVTFQSKLDSVRKTKQKGEPGNE